MECKLVYLKENTVINVEKDTQFILSSVETYGTQRTIELAFNTPNVRAEIIGLYFVKEGQSLDLTTITTHKAPNTGCFTNIRAVLSNNAKSKYIGKIIIKKSAQQTTSFLHDSVLVVGNNTQNTSEPILEIDANDVKASHGATTGRINKDQIYYLMSHGLDRIEAEKLIVEGFFEEQLTKILNKEIREEVLKSLL